MSPIKTTEIAGDVAVSRHVTIGGNATVQGNTTVKKNLKVEGWLEARNIKGTNKGLFATAAKLRETYPHPHDGWHALVGKTLPADVYIAEGGDWAATGETGGNPPLDIQEYDESFDEIRGDLREIEVSVAGHTTEIESLRQTQASHAKELGELKKSADKAQETADRAQETADRAQTTADKAMPRTIDVSQLDTMGTDGTLGAMMGLCVNTAHTRYAVVKTQEGATRTMGCLDMMADDMLHVVTQVLTTHNVFEHGALNPSAHTDGRIRQYYRSYGISGGDGSVAAGAWSKWAEMRPESQEPVRCEDEADLAEKAAGDGYAVGQQFYIPEE